jgi:RNA polymerase sigma-70 factor (ECF subfamily)
MGFTPPVEQPRTPDDEAGDVTQLLAQASGGDIAALNRVLPLVYDELRRIAHMRLRAERDGHTLSTTALVHEAYLKLVEQERVEWRSRTHFYAVASEAMRRILVNYAHARRAAKRGGGAVHVPLDEALVPLDDEQVEELIEIDEALTRLEAFNPRGASVVVHRFFGGLGHAEIAEILGVSEVTVRRSWTSAKAWLRGELDGGAGDWAGSRLT